MPYLHIGIYVKKKSYIATSYFQYFVICYINFNSFFGDFQTFVFLFSAKLLYAMVEAADLILCNAYSAAYALVNTYTIIGDYGVTFQCQGWHIFR